MGGPFLPPTPGGLAPDAGLAPVSLPAFVSPPRGSTPIDVAYGPTTVSPVDGSRELSVTIGGPIVCPGGAELRISHIGFGSVDPTGLVFAIYTLTVNDSPVNSYTNQPLAIGTLDQPGDVFLHVKGPATVRVFISNGFPLSPFVYNARVKGWIYQGGQP